MGGGLMQLVAYGAQDVYLTGNPQITFFKVVYRRHTNFSVETIEHPLSSTPDFGKTANVTIHRNGDLATRMYLKVVLNSMSVSGGNAAYVKRVGHALLKSCELEIGGSKIDKQYGTWMDIWYELSHSQGQEDGYNAMVGDTAALTTMGTSFAETTLYIPLQFWFCRNTGLALPLIALQYHEVRVQFVFNEASSCISRQSAASATPSMKDASLLVDYVYLDSEERRRFAQVGHEYLIEQLQFTGTEAASTSTNKYKLGFNHPTKELIFAMRVGRYAGGTFLGADADECAQELVRSKFATDAGTDHDAYDETVSEGLVSGTSSYSNLITVDNEYSGTLYFIGGADCGALFANSVQSATVRIDSLGANTVATVVHTITDAEASQLVSEMTDVRSSDADALSVAGAGVVLNLPSNYGLYSNGTGNPVSEALLQLNGHDRFDTQSGDYFNYVQPFQHHSNTPAAGINVYSFALHPEQHQPSGTANLSRIDNTQLSVWFKTDAVAGINYLASDSNDVYVYACSNNVLRIMSGMGGLAYSN